MIREQDNHYTIQWIPSHVSISGNEEADDANEGCHLKEISLLKMQFYRKLIWNRGTEYAPNGNDIKILTRLWTNHELCGVKKTCVQACWNDGVRLMFCDQRPLKHILIHCKKYVVKRSIGWNNDLNMKKCKSITNFYHSANLDFWNSSLFEWPDIMKELTEYDPRITPEIKVTTTMLIDLLNNWVGDVMLSLNLRRRTYKTYKNSSTYCS